MNALSRFLRFIKKYFVNPEWRCLACGAEIFEEGAHFCKKCKEELPFIEGAYCNHCGRKTKVPEEYCNTCKNVLVNIDKGRSVFRYDKPVNGLIKRAKYKGEKYILSAFAEYLASAYFKHYMAADFICYVPMTAKTEKRRGYNHGKVLAEMVSELTKVPVLHCIEKKRETERQVKLTREERRKNLDGAFRITDKKAVKGKTALIIDDVATTGATSETLAELLKKSGAAAVLLLTVASVSFDNE